MIRINLLPVRATKKKETVRQQISIFVVSVVIAALIVMAVFSVTLAKISSANKEIEESEKDLLKLKAKIGEIDNIKKLQEAVKKKLDVLNALRKEKMGPASRMAKLSDAVPDKLWLTKYAESGDNIAISGIAFNEDLIAEFIRNLQASKDFTNVELLLSEQLELSGIKAKRFELTAVLFGVKKAEPQQPQKK